MFGTWFYHQRLRKSVAVFGTLFNNLYVLRKNSSGGTISQVKVPLSYAPSRKYLERIRENPNLSDNTKVALKLPRMSFEIISIQYDAGRQIVEQILPFFNPQYSVTIKPFGATFPNVKEDIPIALTGVDFADDYEGSLEQRRTIIYTLTFDMRINFYGPIAESKIIRTAETNMFEINRGLRDSDMQVAKFRTKPNPFNVSADSDFGFNDSADYNYLFDFDST